MPRYSRKLNDGEAVAFGKDTEYPANCVYSTGDGFSGWFAISDNQKCSDFCFWDTALPDYTPFNTADPHVTTTAPNKDQWRCAFQADGDDVMWDDLKSIARKQTQPWLEHNESFPYLRCQGGSGDVIETPGYHMLRSVAFWSIMLVISLLLLGFEMAWIFHRRLIRRAKQRSRLRRCCLIFAVLFTNVLVVLLIFISIVSLVQLGGRYTSFTLQQFTPFCTDPDTICTKANSDIDQPSYKEQLPTEPFSYLIASDVQLDWYDGESAYIGRRNYYPCSESMSCQECTSFFGQYTNTQMKKSMEMLTIDDNFTHSLVMNGDLTAYFHRPQRLKYESFYHNMNAGIKNYYPSLGNHEYDHGDTTYNGDQWVGPKSCNAAHSLGYLKGGFCGKIPRFDPQRVVRYHAQSLAYSWEEGKYHFVHLHYYPNYEHSKIGLGSSMKWLDRDLDVAHDAGLATILFVHAAQGLNEAMRRILSGRGVVAIFAGHTHRCLLNKCEGLYRLSVDEAENPKKIREAQKCLPATINLCGDRANANFMSLFYLKDVEPNYVLPKRELFYDSPNDDDDLCPKPSPPYINKTDQTLLCRRTVFNEPNFFPVDSNESIPIIWSGSASFETFLKADFYEDQIVINAITAEKGLEGERYVDTHDLPNAVYPFHSRTDMEEIVIPIYM